MNYKKFFASIFCLSIFLSAAFCGSYKPAFNVSDFINQVNEADNNVQITKDGTDYIITSQESDNAMIFYPGGAVQYESYLPLLVKCAEQGISCILVKMPCDLAIYKKDAAKSIRHNSNYANIKHWYIGGHSLGGAMAAVYINKVASEYEGLVLLAAYSIDDLTKSGLKVISIYGSEDGVLNIEKYNKYKQNLPDDFKEWVLEGGNHGQFGVYGAQKKDNPASITGEEQMEKTALLVKEYLLN